MDITCSLYAPIINISNRADIDTWKVIKKISFTKTLPQVKVNVTVLVVLEEPRCVVF